MSVPARGRVYWIDGLRAVVVIGIALFHSALAPSLIPRMPKRYRATWNGAVIAERADTVAVEGNQYFLLGDVRGEHLKPSDTHTTCHWKGIAGYYDVVVGDGVNRDAAWYYPDPSKAPSASATGSRSGEAFEVGALLALVGFVIALTVLRVRASRPVAEALPRAA